MSDIARRAGVAEGTVYLYFENKAALLGAVQAKFYEELTAKAVAGVASIKQTRTRLEFLARLHLETLVEDWPTVVIVLASRRDFGEHVERDEHYQFNRAYVAVFDGVVRDGVNRGELREDIPLWLLRDMFYGTLEYALRTTLLHDRRAEVGQTVERMLEAFFGGIAAAKPAEEQTSPLEHIVDRLEGIAERLQFGTSKGDPDQD